MTGYNGSTQTGGYDGDGLRTWKQTDSDGDGSLRTYFLYDGTSPVVEEDGTGGFYASNTFGADGLVSRFPGESLDIVALTASDEPSDSSEFYTFDERGDVSERVNVVSTSGGPKGPALSGTSGSSVSATSEVYDAYGSRTAQSPQPEPWGFGAQAGYYTDTETGLILCTHRFYDPATGRWLTRDPIGYGGGVNLYGYVGNDPGNRWDPSGYYTPSNGGLIGGGIGTVVGVGIGIAIVAVGIATGGAAIPVIIAAGAIGGGIGGLTGGLITGSPNPIADGGIGVAIGAFTGFSLCYSFIGGGKGGGSGMDDSGSGYGYGDTEPGGKNPFSGDGYES